MYLWAHLKKRSPQIPEIHFRKPFDYWASNFAMSSLTSQETKKLPRGDHYNRLYGFRC